MEKTVLDRKTQDAPNIKRVAAYCRVATGGAGPLYGLETQKAYYTQKINENTEWKMAGIFADETPSGPCLKKRKEFSRMIAACKRGRIDIILTKSVSRFARNTRDCVETVRMLKASGVGVIFEKENIDTRNESCDLIMDLLCQFTVEEWKCMTPNLIYPVSKRPL